MILRILILVIAILLHILTPHWFLKDYLTVGDWIMIFFAFLSAAMYNSMRGIKKINFLSVFLSLNVLVYFIITTQILAPDVGVERAVCRLQFILRNSITLPIIISSWIEIINTIQIIFSIAIGILLVFQFYKKKTANKLTKA